jgi:hypothetical protein
MAVYVCQQLFEGRLHPYGERPGVDDNSRALPFFEPQSAQVESALRHGAQSEPSPSFSSWRDFTAKHQSS